MWGDQITIIPDDNNKLEVIGQLPKVKVIEPRQPRVIIYDVELDLEVEDLLHGLVYQNPELVLSVEAADTLCVKHKLGPRSGSTTHLVIEVPLKVLHKLENKSVFLGLVK